MIIKSFLLFTITLFWFAPLGFLSYAQSQEISPAQEQEYFDAKKALDAAKQAQAEKYALETFQKAQDLLTTAENARAFKDGIKFVQASRLARAYAELAQTIAELKTEEEKLAATYEELNKAKAEMSRLQKIP